MKKTLIILSSFALLVACSPKTTEAVVEDVTEAAMPTGDAAQGKLIYESKCNTCHKLKTIDKYSSESWDKILPNMAEKAELASADQALVDQYVRWELGN